MTLGGARLINFGPYRFLWEQMLLLYGKIVTFAH